VRGEKNPIEVTCVGGEGEVGDIGNLNHTQGKKTKIQEKDWEL